MSFKAEDDLINIKNAARMCERNPETIRRWIWNGKLPAEKLGNQLFIKKSDLESFCQETAILEYKASTAQSANGTSTRTGDEHMKSVREHIQIRLGRDFGGDEVNNLMRQMRDDEMLELNEISQREVTRLEPGSRSDLIQKMRDLRQQIHTRIGRDFTEAEIDDMIHKMREDRDNEISGLC